jgi:hypothetical protein
VVAQPLWHCWLGRLSERHTGHSHHGCQLTATVYFDDTAIPPAAPGRMNSPGFRAGRFASPGGVFVDERGADTNDVGRALA